jgi:proteic killer suppression protein
MAKSFNTLKNKLSAESRIRIEERVNHQWRLCFEWKDVDAYNVEIVDYHGRK